MKTFLTIFFAILAAAAVIFTALWAKSRVDSWEQAWRSCEAQMAAIISTEEAYGRASRYSSSYGSPEVGLHDAIVGLQRIKDAEVQIAQLDRTMVAILENKPFGLPLTATERKELESARENLRKHPETGAATSQAQASTPVPRRATLMTTVQPLDGSTTIPAGTNVELLSQDESNAHVRYAGREFIVPNSMVTESQ
jgi:hypothetical protein